jgi:hypothetical protein
MPKQGKITANGVVLEVHELKTVVFLTGLGFNVELLVPNQHKGSKTADIKMNGLEWEIKSPTKLGKYTIDHATRDGLRQSENLIFDLRRIRNTGKRATIKLEKDFMAAKRWRRLIIITKEQKVLTFEK